MAKKGVKKGGSKYDGGAKTTGIKVVRASESCPGGMKKAKPKDSKASGCQMY